MTILRKHTKLAEFRKIDKVDIFDNLTHNINNIDSRNIDKSDSDSIDNSDSSNRETCVSHGHETSSISNNVNIQTKQYILEDIEFEKENLTKEQQYELLKCLNSNSGILVHSQSEVTHARDLKANTHSGESEPVKQKPSRVDSRPSEKLNKHRLVQDVLDDKITQTSKSQWNYPVTLIRKPNNLFYFALDLRSIKHRIVSGRFLYLEII